MKKQVTDKHMSGADVFRARAKLGLSVSEMAYFLGYKDPNGAHVQHIESDRRNMREPQIRLLEAYLSGYRPPDWKSARRRTLTMQPEQALRARETLGLDFDSMAAMLGYTGVCRKTMAQRLEYVATHKERRIVGDPQFRLYEAYLNGYRPADWPKPMDRVQDLDLGGKSSGRPKTIQRAA
jgi:transcriptional regulator with XRE-family HTH domain